VAAVAARAVVAAAFAGPAAAAQGSTFDLLHLAALLHLMVAAVWKVLASPLAAAGLDENFAAASQLLEPRDLSPLAH